MAKSILLHLLLLILPGLVPVFAQQIPSPERPNRDWPLIVCLQFHSISMPFKDLKSTFSNVGISLGTELAYNRRSNFLQQIQVGVYRNKYAGNGLSVFTQTAYRPHVGPVYAEVKAGLGYNFAFHPNTTRVFTNGEWQSASQKGKGLLMVPVGVSICYQSKKTRPVFEPFVSYQFFVLQGYNPDVPILPNQLIQVGSRIHLLH
ncbi:hypothetical protein [Larkinella rosea]|uniref:Outer membrane protein beta-barrel domain-containing protein n=1 Tax=Larkinella rosea TaxID=2025312 RepID=A0A3P1BLW4_9BACT|nr:hypothetical protein [Larkinella rosea]RRB01998.1 hypothetical protein EHT25_15995 [Larkinella rosea]